jgi:hypothetical protein
MPTARCALLVIGIALTAVFSAQGFFTDMDDDFDDPFYHYKLCQAELHEASFWTLGTILDLVRKIFWIHDLHSAAAFNNIRDMCKFLFRPSGTLRDLNLNEYDM